MAKEISELFRDLILQNELGGDLHEALRFSDPDGVRSGKSGWSFGVVQFDTQNNDQAIACLRDCGFTDAEIKGIVAQTIDVAPLNSRLAAHAGIIIEYDKKQLQYCINRAVKFASDYQLPIAETSAFLALADTINQYGSLGSATAARFIALARPITAKDILDVKLTWKYATASKQGYKDTLRRYDNILKVMAAA